VDSEVPGLKNLCAGACKVDYHLRNVNYGRDYKADILVDIKRAVEGDPCPECGAPRRLVRGIEVGQIFQLGTKYSESMGAFYKDENMNDQLIVMGCYGVGVTRTMAAVVEQNHDEDGIIWPVAVAPYHVIVTIVRTGDEAQTALAESIYQELLENGVEVLLDDRDERAGVKFKDADLIGIPIRITVGGKASEDVVEYKLRREKGFTEKSSAQAVADAIRLVNEERRGPAGYKQ
jgi:prolyl-tRNA synthetase